MAENAALRCTLTPLTENILTEYFVLIIMFLSYERMGVR
jgi:hypothetical protein